MPAARAARLPGFVDEASCTSCHAEIAQRWTGSHHDLAMQEATEATVLGDFDDVRFEHLGDTTRFFRRDGGFWVETEGPDGARAEFEVAYTFGVEPLQQYLVALPRGRLQCLTVAWDTERGRWYSLYPHDRYPAGDALHWTGRLQNWNAMCAECHSTGLVKGYDPASDSYATRWERIDVGCQACHGPAARHLEWAEGQGGSEDTGFATAIRKGQPGQLDACARCHSRRSPLRDGAVHGAPFLDGYAPERLHAGLYHADGQILDEVYVYGSFVQSRMHERGVTCSDCHDPHSLELWTPGNSLCLQCHSTHAPLERFPTLKASDYDTPEHHFHPPGSPGSQCVACHMPERTYMGIDPRRDHGFRVPRPDLSVEADVPNACNGCHVDESAEWAAARVVEWYGPPDAQRDFAGLFARARRGEPVDDELAALAGRADLPAIVRGTALELLRDPSVAAPAIEAAARDAHALVRASAAGSFRVVAPERRLELFGPLLEDAHLSVRAVAARALASQAASSPGGLGPELQGPHARAYAEYLGAQRLALDLPATNMNAAILRQELSDVMGAVASYERALELDAAFLPARFNLATLLNVMGRNDEAEQVLRGGIELVPNDGELHFSLALLLAEMGNLAGATEAMERAAELLPERDRLHYNLGLLLQGQGRRADAEVALQTAVRSAPLDPDVLHALVRLYVDGEEWGLAWPHAERLVELTGGAPWASALAEEVAAAVGPTFTSDQ